MQLKSFFSFLFAVLLGVALAVVAKIGFILPSVLPMTDLFMLILKSPVGKFALETRGGEGGMMIAIALRAFAFSVVIGALSGVIVRKLRFKRAFCYSALWVPLGDIVLGYLQASTAASSFAGQLAVMQKSIGLAIWADLWIYGWYFLALYISFVIANRIALLIARPLPESAPVG
ncbi:MULTISPECIES: hypothetical protein [unclassified Pseudomonas]|uniref:hypothetical protein n=1 Tax=unclassified Pseudomonas TaxID=196821 RepID=UPI00244CBD5E|nr:MULTISPECIES: hypothetical protein [unclassified Pseudomonas]MDG9925491.1 hypothetical protein [Pseudomonas sp. GD04045]MDH0034068.1 hypothetical protein [Pseudomonas sp. GD04019]